MRHILFSEPKLIENYPVTKESEIPREALKERNARLKGIKRAEPDREIDFMELMGDLDQYNYNQRFDRRR